MSFYRGGGGLSPGDGCPGGTSQIWGGGGVIVLGIIRNILIANQFVLN